MAIRIVPPRWARSRSDRSASRLQRDRDLVDVLARELTELRQEIRRANLIQYHRLIADQLDRAIDDPDLGAAMSTLDGLSERERRQMLFSNREYAVSVLAYRVGMYDWDELVGALRVLCRNAVFAAYWARTVDHRRSLPAESLEGRVGRAVDGVLAELAEDPEEWWVVGGPPDGAERE
ncbi:DUF6082 family protein [Streptomyces sp. NPDC050400]|uniref:DUF6082 family protein n=1 Tax=Streptomyces sp. NPDC050400 TaxID=3365610 RepID=UPI003790F708